MLFSLKRALKSQNWFPKIEPEIVTMGFRLTFLLLPLQSGLLNSLSGLASQCSETLWWCFKQGRESTGHLVSWFIQHSWDLQLYASFSSLCVQVLFNDTARKQAALNYHWCLKSFFFNFIYPCRKVFEQWFFSGKFKVFFFHRRAASL